MICTVLQNKNFDDLLTALDECLMAEIRLDSCEINEDEIGEIFSTADIPLVATCRQERRSYSRLFALWWSEVSVRVRQQCNRPQGYYFAGNCTDSY